jgi:hypothetical protein
MILIDPGLLNLGIQARFPKGFKASPLGMAIEMCAGDRALSGIKPTA